MGAPRQVLMTAQTARMAQGFIETEELGLMAVRGLDDPVQVHRLLGRTSFVGTWGPRVQRELMRFAGRDGELAAVRDGLAAAADDRGRVTDRLRTAEFVYDLATQDALTFKHNLIRAVVYGEIPRDRRRLLHGAIADALDDDADPPLERLAHHTYSAERCERPYAGCGAPRSGPSSGRPTRRPSGSWRWTWTRPRASANAPEHMVRRVDMAGALRSAATGSGGGCIARRHAAAALTFARERDHPLLEVTSLRSLAATTDRAGADAHLRAALEVAAQTQLDGLLEPLRRDRTALLGTGA